MYRYLAGALALFLVVPALAETPSYNFVQAGYQNVDLDVGGGLNVDGDGWLLGGSFEVGEEFFVFAGYSDTGFDFNVDLSEWQAGVGWRMEITTNTDIFARAAYLKAEVDAPIFGSADESGYGIGIGIRSNVTDLVELYGEIAYSDLGSGADGTEIGGGVFFNFSDGFAAGVGASTDDDITVYSVNLRYYFGD